MLKWFLQKAKSSIGFTLIELLIAVVIIAILISLGAVSYSTVARNSRDSQRKSDMSKIQLALEEFFADNGAYPSEKGVNIGGGRWMDYMTCDIDGNVSLDPVIKAGDPFTCNSKTYLAKMPADPLTGGGYFYEINENRDVSEANPAPEPTWCDLPGQGNGVPHGNCKRYTLWTRLENTNDPLVLATRKDPICQEANAVEWSIPGPEGYNYCVHN